MVSVYENSQKSTRKSEESIACFGKPILGVHPAIPPLILDLLPYMGISLIAGQSDAVIFIWGYIWGYISVMVLQDQALARVVAMSSNDASSYILGSFDIM